MAGAADPARAQEAASRPILVVVSPANPTSALKVAQLRRIFLREQTVWANGSPIAVFERSTENPIRTQFSSMVLGKAPSQLAEYWLNLALTRGLEPPKVCRTGALLKQYLERTKGGIGYVYADELADGLKIIARATPKGRK